MTKSPSLRRQHYLEGVVLAAGKAFHELGYKLPGKIRISVGFPKGSRGEGKVIAGQCWPHEASTDGFSEIFISPLMRETRQIIETTIHELIHALVGCEEGHKGMFKKVALEIGFVAPMTSTPAGPKMQDLVQRIAADLGRYPGGAINIANRKVQGTRLLKCECGECGYTVRVTRKWVEAAGPPVCPTDDISLTCDAIDEEEEG